MKGKPTKAIVFDKREVMALNSIAQAFVSIKKSVSRSFVRFSEIEAYARRSALTKEHLTSWNRICIFPYAGFLEYVFSQSVEEIKKHFPTEERFSRIIETTEVLYAALLWGLTARIYRLTPELEHHIDSYVCGKDDPVPTPILINLPEWSLLIATPGLCMAEKNIMGFFAYVDFEPEIGTLLNIVFVTTEREAFALRLSLKKGVTYGEAVVGKKIASLAWDRFCEKNPKFKDKKIALPEAMTPELQDFALSVAIPRILCVCAQNADLYDLKRKKEIKRLLLLAEKNLSGTMHFADVNRTQTLVLVGSKIKLGPNPKIDFGVNIETKQFDVFDSSLEENVEEDDPEDVQPETAAPVPSVNPSLVRVWKDKLVQAREQEKKNSYKLSQAAEEIRRLKAQNEASLVKLKECEGKCATLNTQVRRLNELNAQKSDEYAQLKKEIDDVLAENITLNKHNGELAALVEPQKKRIETLSEIAEKVSTENAALDETSRKHAEESRKYRDLYLGISKEHEDVVQKVTALQSELSDAQHNLTEAHREITMLSSENAKIRHEVLSKSDAENSAGEVNSSAPEANQEALRKFFFGEELCPTESLKLIEMLYGAKVSILPSAWESALTIDHSFKQTKELTKSLFLLVNDYLSDYLSGGDNKARHIFGVKYSAQESNGLQKSSKLMRERVFSGVQMQQHLRIGYSERLYFTVDVPNKKIIIGYCGNHLAIISR